MPDQQILSGQTLVLNQGYQAHDIIPWYQAITLLVTEKADVVEEYDIDIRSAYLTMKMPAVIALRGKVKRYKKPVKFSRVNVYSRDNFTCQYCGGRKTMDELTYDHVTPRCKGGKTVWNNIASACYDCNERKGGRTPKQAGMKLLSEPVQPVEVPHATIRIARQNVPPQWQEYLDWSSK